jgi:mannose-6-phosphate isomerase-like protein (cupin superfamily)|tara:strand:- start:3040 stop:3405 length:366 start_codon:yes stop_codon:yes gene_type:complete
MERMQLFNGNTLVKKPWGSYTDIYRSPSVTFKKIDINPGEEISYQYHHGRDEFWYISSGQGVFTIEDEERGALPGDVLLIARGEKHKIKNTGNFPLTIFETQCGICSEDDIVRLTDKYDRD